MRYSFENEFLKVTVDSLGSELVSVINKETGAEMMWQGNPDVWPRQAPVLFPNCGKIKGGEYTLDGKTYKGLQHGIVRDYEHEFKGVEGNTMRFSFDANEESLALFPRHYRFESIFTLEGRRLIQTLKVTNTDDKELRFGIGFHPGFAFPFDDKHTTADYELRFDTVQTPMVRETVQEGPSAGFVDDKYYPIVENSQVIPLNDRIFDNDSLALCKMTAKTMAIYEKDTGRSLTVRIEDYPYVVIWSKPHTDTLKFFCIEPWKNLQDHKDATGNWNDKECAAVLAPGEEYSTALDMTFDR